MSARSFLFALIAALSLGTGTASASLVTFFGEDLNPGNTVPAGGNAAAARASFLLGLSGTATETFEGVSTGSYSSLSLSFPGSSGTLGATLTGNVSVVQTAGGGRFATSGSRYVQGSAGGGFTLAFSEGVSAFGFYGTDIGDANGRLTLRLTPSGGGSAVDLVVPHSVGGSSLNGALLFFGFTDTTTSYTGIQFLNSSTGDVFGFDDMVIGDREQLTGVIPLPAPMLLLASGLVLLGGLGRRRRG